MAGFDNEIRTGPMGLYLRPTELSSAIAELAARPRTIVAGGTDFYPARVGRTIDVDILDITAIAALRGIRDEGDHFRIGATTSWSEILAAPLPPCFDALKLAAREVGGQQIQNAGTICGNLCNASPAADGVPPLLALGAAVEVQGTAGPRTMPLDAFILGPRRVRRAVDELVTAVLVPKPATRNAGHFLKLGARRYLVISIVMAAACLEADEAGVVTRARVAIGACSPVAQRLEALEEALLGKDIASGLGSVVTPDHFAHLTPIDDVRATRAYRLEAAATVVSRLLDEVAGRL